MAYSGHPSRKVRQETVNSIYRGLLDDVIMIDDDDKYREMCSTFGYHQEWPDFGMPGAPQETSNTNHMVSCSSSSNSSSKKRKPNASLDAKGDGDNSCKRQRGGDDQAVAGEEKGKQLKPKVASKKKAAPATSKDSRTSTATDQKADYIHVRARRGQATDSHSIAERVRRERISERMKYLQELVPGCNKVTGKAGMLDEIINYVQSLQRQVEFLSMKIAASNPVVNFNIVEDLFSRQMNQTCNPAALPAMTPIEQLEPSGLQFDPMQMQPAGSPCFGLEMVMNNPSPAPSAPMSTAMPVSMPGTSIDPRLNVNDAAVWDIGSQNMFGVFDVPFQSLQGDCLLDNLKMEI